MKARKRSVKPPITKGHLTLLEESMQPEAPLPPPPTIPEGWGDTQRLAWVLVNDAHWSPNINTICYVDLDGATCFVRGHDYNDAIDRAAHESGVLGDGGETVA